MDRTRSENGWYATAMGASTESDTALVSVSGSGTRGPRTTRHTVTPGENRAAVLIVVDDRVIRSLLDQALRSIDYDVVVASSGREALEGVASAAVDLVVAVNTHPSTDALRLLVRLQEESTIRGIPGIFLSAQDTSGSNLPLATDLLRPQSFDVGEILAQVRAKLTVPVDPTVITLSRRDDFAVGARRPEIEPVRRARLGRLRTVAELARYVGRSLIGRGDITVHLTVEPAPRRHDEAPTARSRGLDRIAAVTIAKEEPHRNDDSVPRQLSDRPS